MNITTAATQPLRDFLTLRKDSRGGISTMWHIVTDKKEFLALVTIHGS